MENRSEIVRKDLDYTCRPSTTNPNITLMVPRIKCLNVVFHCCFLSPPTTTKHHASAVCMWTTEITTVVPHSSYGTVSIENLVSHLQESNTAGFDELGN